MHAVGNSQPLIVVSSAPSLPRPSSPISAAAPIATPRASDTVEISGRALLLSRLPGIVGEPGSASGSIYSFLTASDQEMLATVYKSSFDAGVDLQQVDALAFDLGVFRSSPQSLDKVGVVFDSNGVPIEFAFSSEEEVIAQRILTSTAIKDSAIPSEFLRHFLDPGLAPGDHAVDFAFLEKLVYSTSTTGSNGATDPQAVLSPRPAERLALMRASGAFSDSSTARAGSPDDFVPDEASTSFPAELMNVRARVNQAWLDTLLRPSGDQYLPWTEVMREHRDGEQKEIAATHDHAHTRSSSLLAGAATNLDPTDKQMGAS